MGGWEIVPLRGRGRRLTSGWAYPESNEGMLALRGRRLYLLENTHPWGEVGFGSKPNATSAVLALFQPAPTVELRTEPR